MKLGRQVKVAAALVLVALALAYGFWPRPVAVDAARASRGPLRVTVEEEGKTRVRERFIVSAPTAGFMRRITLEAGDTVKKGQAVAELEPLKSGALDPRTRASAEANVRAAEASLRRAEENSRAAGAEATYARKRLERTRELFGSGFAAKDVLDQAESESRRADATLLSAESAVNEARFILERARAELRSYPAEGGTGSGKNVLRVRTPVDGKVLKLHRESEGAVGAGEPLIDIGDPEKLEIRAEVLSADAVKMGPGTPVVFERWGGGEPLTGIVRSVEPEAFTKTSSLGVEEQRVFVISDITSPPEKWRTLGDGYRVEANFIIWEGTEVLQIPANALFRAGEEMAVFAVSGGRAELKKVKVGHRNGLIAEVVSGLSEGAQVITHPDDSVKDGRRVKVRK